MEEVLVARKFSECVRLEIESSAPVPLHDRIMQICLLYTSRCV